MCAASRKSRPKSASAIRSRPSTRSPADAPFNKPHTNVCNIATLYPQYYQLVVPADAGINGVKDLKGKGITTQQRGNTGELITQQLLQVNGLTYNDVKMSFVSYTTRCPR